MVSYGFKFFMAYSIQAQGYKKDNKGDNNK